MTALPVRDGRGEGNAAWVRALGLASAIDADPARTFPDVIAVLAARHGDRPALIGARESYGFAALDARAARYAAWALSLGLRSGDTVALLMGNRPDYLAAWIGLTRIGVVVALLNANLQGASLAHCVAAAAPRHAIVEDRLVESWLSALPHLGAAPTLWVHGEAVAGEALAPALDAQGPGTLARDGRPAPRTADPALLIYTSGTTGLPKAARVSHHRVMMWSHWFAGMADTGPDDRLYNALPLYHSVGGVVATGAPLVGGGSVVIAERFSAARFWTEVAATDCTLVQYIGELCRYLLKAPPAAADTAHRVRLACGNGLRADVWEHFQRRFAIPRILEFYAATEGNFSLYNVDGRVGAIGRIPSFMAARFSAAVVRHDETTGLPMRGADGFCLRCAPGEAGEAIGRIATGEGAGAARFEGYTSAADTEKKVLRNVFKPGDAWFRTGDLMRLDRQGFFTFVDRIGDTFRWKGENVATAEVEAVLTAAPGIAEAQVYGVEVAGADGKAGMAALVVDSFDPAALRAHLADRLPPYAWPVFLRLQDGFALTETFKRKKADLVRAGFDPSSVADPLWVHDPAAGAYRRLDASAMAAIAAGTMRL